ncbi:MAG: glycosyltransferase family 2 protein [Elusimicrobiota bacterium]
MNLTITVIIDTYNYGRFIDKAAESAMNQDFPKDKYEILVIDDESTDDTAERVRKYGDKIRYICQKNTGQAGVFNTGFENSKGEIICFLDADDYWYPGKLKAVAAAFDKHPEVGLVQHPSDYVDENCSRMDKSFEVLPEFYDLPYFLNSNVSFYGTTNLSFRKSYLSKIMPEPLVMGNYADQYLYWNMLFYAKVYNLNTALAAHRIHGSNWYAKMYSSPKMLDMHITVLEAGNLSVRDNFKKFGITLLREPPALLDQDIEILKEKVILYRLRFELFEALKAYSGIFRLKLSNFALFKSMTLFLALIHPNLYLWFFRLYSRKGFLLKIREKLMPFKA